MPVTLTIERNGDQQDIAVRAPLPKVFYETETCVNYNESAANFGQPQT